MKDEVKQTASVTVEPIDNAIGTYEQAQGALDTAIDEATTAEHDKQDKTTFAVSFTKGDVTTLIALWSRGHTVREIAERMGRSYNNVRNKVAALQKKGEIKPRDPKNKLPDGYIQGTAARFMIPVDVVQYLSSFFGGSAADMMKNIDEAAARYKAQKGQCAYLGERVTMTMDTTPSGLVVIPGEPMMLCCRAVAGMRMSMSHESFVGVCRAIALRFGG